MEKRLYRRSVEGGSIALCSSAAPANRTKNSRSVWFKSTKKHFYRLNPPSRRIDRTVLAKYILGFNTPVIARPNHVLPLGFLS